ncbi:uncharacterized protein LOC118327246 [Morone saxatilis]|uniref:uncharacterized protein LOC118327246 n=1 Tax=Morone saxatilis TaxID=34816 RepID=UPI0015E25830|nr:uncharacterized protein LOC118327246 [Morone saxatilis]
MAEIPAGKVAIPALATTAYTTKLPKRRKTDLTRRTAKRESDYRRNKTRVNIGEAFQRWRELRKCLGLSLDSELAVLLLDSYLRTKSESRPERPTVKRSSSTETCESVHIYPLVMNPPVEYEPEAYPAASVHSPENGKESGEKDGACQRLNSQDEETRWTTSNPSENKENRDIQEDKNEEFSTSLSVGDGHYLVDLGSSSEFIVDEECILQLFRSCRECNRQCTVRKRVKGLKLVVSQACCFCESRYKWTNLPDDDDDFQINGNDAAHGQINSALSPSSNTS